MASKTEILNLALSHIGIAKDVADIDTEKTAEATAGRRFFDTVRDIVLRDFPWPFATKIVTLALVETNPQADGGEWGFSYRYPSDAIWIRRIISGLRNDTRQSRESYRIRQDSQGLLIFTDMTDAKAEYTFRETDPGRYSAEFTNALALRLSVYIAPRLTAGDPFNLRRQNLQLYRLEIAKARGSAANEEQLDEVPDSEFVRTREGDTVTGDRGQDFVDVF